MPVPIDPPTPPMCIATFLYCSLLKTSLPHVKFTIPFILAPIRWASLGSEAFSNENQGPRNATFVYTEPGSLSRSLSHNGTSLLAFLPITLRYGL